MHLHINHMYCTDSNWGGSFSTRYMLVIERFDNRTIHPEKYTVEHPDWTEGKLLRWDIVRSQRKYNASMSYYDKREAEALAESDIYVRDHEYEHGVSELMAECHDVAFLQGEVLDWLHENIADTADGKGWCIGSDEYRCDDMFGLSIWFVRKRDAMKFAKRWSSYGNLTTYFDYFNEVRKELQDGKLVEIDY